MSYITREDMYLILCEWSLRVWDREKHCPQKMRLFTQDKIYDLEPAKGNARTLDVLPDTAADIRRLAKERYGIKIEERITHVEFVRPPNRVRFQIKE